MPDHLFSAEDLRQMETHGIPLDKVLEQIEIFKRNSSYVRLERPCTLGDGIRALEEHRAEALIREFGKAQAAGRCMKFVPASGAATRMFKALFKALESGAPPSCGENPDNDPDRAAVVEFIQGLERFAFYPALRQALAEAGMDLEALKAAGRCREILKYLLTEEGLGYGHLPKGLIPFHRYGGEIRTPFQEHLVEAAGYVEDATGLSRVHFTVPAEHAAAIQEHIERFQERQAARGRRFQVTFSTQDPATDTLAVDPQNRPFRDQRGRLIFRPGGHGALLPNLNALRGDLVFLKNIDNVVPDRLQPLVWWHKRALGGLLVELQTRCFQHLRALEPEYPSQEALDRALGFAETVFFRQRPAEWDDLDGAGRRRWLITWLNRPLRVCGMVRNAGEPGGGPFWVRDEDGGLSLQVVESAQVNQEDPEQHAIWNAATHFSPVDMVCGVRDCQGRLFNLEDYVDPAAVFITRKFLEGRELKALELPGLWNGGMARWNSVFVEVPRATFNPVKTVNDLLGEAHAP